MPHPTPSAYDDADIRALKACMEVVMREPRRWRQLESMRLHDRNGRTAVARLQIAGVSISHRAIGTLFKAGDRIGWPYDLLRHGISASQAVELGRRVIASFSANRSRASKPARKPH